MVVKFVSNLNFSFNCVKVWVSNSFGVKVPTCRCHWDGRPCFEDACSSLDMSGVVCLCSRHKNPSGFHVSRVQGSPVVSIFSKHGGR